MIKVLVVEDSSNQAFKLQNLLEERGYKVTVAVNGKKALDAVQMHKPDLIISDIIMPEMDGYQLCSQIKTDENTKDIPVILLTTLSDQEDIVLGLIAKSDYYITKPYNEKYLLTKVESILAVNGSQAREKPQKGLEVTSKGKRYVITSGPRQILNLLLSTYDNAVQQYRELLKTKKDLSILNKTLEKKVEKRTAALREDITERLSAEQAGKQVEKKLKESERRLALAVEGAGLGLWDQDFSSGKIIRNERWAQMLGYELDEIEQSRSAWKELIHPDDLLTLEKCIKEHEQGKSSLYNVEHRMRAKDGEWKWIHNWGRIVERDKNGRPLRALGVHLDITERKRAEEELKKLSVAVQQSPVSVVITDTDGVIEYVNPTFENLTGYSLDEAIGLKPSVLKSGITPESEYRKLWKTITAGKVWAGEFLNKKKNGELFWESATIAPVIDNNNNITHFLAVKDDITEKKNIISELMDREEKYRTLTQNLNVGVYRSTPGKDGIFIEANPAFLNIFEFRSKNELERYKVVDFYPDPKERKSIEEKLASTGFLINEVIKLRKKDGTTFIASISTTSATDESGNIIHYDGIIEDITERKEMMKRIIQERDRSQLYLDIAGVMFLALDRKGDIVLANQKTCEIIGTTEENLIGKNWITHHIPQDIQLSVKDVFNNLMDGNTELAKFNENEILTTSGEKRLIAWHNSTLKDESGKIFGIISSGLDITEENRAREDILVYQSNLKSLTNELLVTEEEAKRRLAMTLHDKLGQSLVLAKFKTDELNKKTTNSENKKIIDEITSFIEEAINESRNITYELSPPVLYEMGLVPAISWKLDKIEKNNKIKTSLIDQSKSYEIGEREQIILYRSINELLQNVLKHSKAESVKVSFMLLTNDYRVTVSDNGIGFDLEAMRGKAVSQKKFGLFSIMERIRFIGGEVIINTVPNKGTKVVINLPIKN